MDELLKQGACRGRWSFQVHNAASGVLELWETAVGYIWNWSDKPGHLVALNGVRDGYAKGKPWRFVGFNEAVAHILYCSGVAYGDCSLAETSH